MALWVKTRNIFTDYDVLVVHEILCYNYLNCMEIAIKKFSHFLLVSGLTAFIAVSFFGISLTMGMEKMADGSMGGCLFTSMEKICYMTFSEHLSRWQSMFTATVTKNTFVQVLLLLLAVVFVAVAIFKRNFLLLFSDYITRWRLYMRDNPEFSLFDNLREAFSQGMLNPKIY